MKDHRSVRVRTVVTGGNVNEEEAHRRIEPPPPLTCTTVRLRYDTSSTTMDMTTAGLVAPT